MAWTSPKTWSVGEVVTASNMNTHLRDNLKYLKGQGGVVYLEDQVAIGVNQTSGSFMANAILQVGNDTIAGAQYCGVHADAAQHAGFIIGSDAARKWAIYRPASSNDLAFFSDAFGAEIMRLDADAGYVGIGTSSPKGPFQLALAAGGVAFLSAAAVAGSVVTLATALCAAGATFFIADQNNTTTTVFQGATGVAVQLSGTHAYVNTDTITITVTAGGNITAQRTTGTNGTHDINMLVFYY